MGKHLTNEQIAGIRAHLTAKNAPKFWSQFLPWAVNYLGYKNNHDSLRRNLQRRPELRILMKALKDVPDLKPAHKRLRLAMARSVAGQRPTLLTKQFIKMDSVKLGLTQSPLKGPERALTVAGTTRTRAVKYMPQGTTSTKTAEAYAIVHESGATELVFLREVGQGRESHPTMETVVKILRRLLPQIRAIINRDAELKGMPIYLVMDRPRWHNNQTVMDEIGRLGFEVCDHAALSQDMNLIEKCWAWLRVQLQGHKAKSLAGFKRVAKQRWRDMFQTYDLKGLFTRYWPQHLRNVIAAKGGLA